MGLFNGTLIDEIIWSSDIDILLRNHDITIYVIGLVCLLEKGF